MKSRLLPGLDVYSLYIAKVKKKECILRASRISLAKVYIVIKNCVSGKRWRQQKEGYYASRC